MTINTQDITSGPYTGNGVADTFAYDFLITAKTELRVIQTDTDGLQSVLVVDTDYTVTGVGTEIGGTIVLTAPLTSGYTLYIRSAIDSTQATDFNSQGGFFPDIHEAALDKITLLVQQLEDAAARGFGISQDIDIDGSFQLNEIAADRASKYIAFDGNGDLIVATDPGVLPSSSEIDLSGTVDAMKSKSLDVGVTATTQGYTVAGVGGATYLIVAPQAADGYGDHVLANGNVAVQQIQNNIFNIAKFGAVDGAADNTLPMRAAMEAAAVNGGFYYVPIGLWIHDQIDWRSNVWGWGAGKESIDQRLSDVGNPTVTKVGYRFFNTDTVAPFDPALNLSNVKIYGIQFLGTVAADAFSEFKHLLMFQGASDIEITGCWFTGWQGDAIVVRSGNNTAAAQNYNISIHNNVFDGVNKDNRNAISTTDCTNMWIMFNDFKNCSRSDMPGAVDFEPNITDTFIQMKNINVLYNTFENIGGMVAAIAVFLGPTEGTFTNGDPEGFNIHYNSMDNVYSGVRIAQAQVADLTDAAHDAKYSVIGNTCRNSTDRPFWYYGVKGVTARDNVWEDGANASRVGWSAVNLACNSISIRDKFIRCGTTDGAGINIYKSRRVSVEDSTFEDVGASGGGFGVPITVAAGASSILKINRNTIINNLGLTTGTVSVSGSVIAGGNELIGNDFAGLGVSATWAETTEYGERSFTGGITATAGGQSTATQLTTVLNVVSTASAFDSVKLPSALGLGEYVSVRNTSGATVQVYPFLNDDLGNGVNAPQSIVTNTTATYRSVDVANWFIQST